MKINVKNNIIIGQIGRSGLITPELKREGDGCTPLGTYPLREVWYRADRVGRPETTLPVREITEADCWCDDVAHALYNKHFQLTPTPSSGKELPSPFMGEGQGGGARQKKLLPFSKQLRKHMTDAEKILWYHVRAHRLGGYGFRRQHEMGGKYIVDFVCLEKKIIIELDGGQHVESKKDEARDAFLKREGFQVLRFWNHDIFQNKEGVMETIWNALESNVPITSSSNILVTPSLTLPPSGGGDAPGGGNIMPHLPHSFEHLWREDGAYDVIVVIGYNDAPPVAGKGSAIFIHCNHDDGRPTAGCVAVEKADLLELLTTLSAKSQIEISQDAVRIIF